MNIRLPTIILKPRNQLQIRKSLKLEQAAQPQVQNSKEKEKSEEEKNHSDQKNLPQTGEGQSILASLGFLLLGAFYLFRRGKNN